MQVGGVFQLTMKIFFSKHVPGYALGDAIEALTHGSVHHAGFIRRSGLILEAVPPHVRQRPVTAADRAEISVFTLRGLTPALADAFEQEFDRILAAPPAYSGEDLFGFLFNQPNTDEAHTFCSRLVMHTIMRIAPPELWPQVRCMAGDWVSPRDLFISPMLIPYSL